jgi:hypothetical protein
MPTTIPLQDLQNILDGFIEEAEALRRAHEDTIRGIVRRIERRRREDILREVAVYHEDGQE